MSSPIIKIKQGELRGKICQDADGNVYYGFLGIPYAKPPLGNLRFKAPQPPTEPWVGVRDATEDGSECYSYDMLLQKLSGSEDCLFLNVYTNEIPKNNINLKPVMVWIHGGGFTCGSNNSNVYGPQFLMCEDVVVVSINYRIGVLGFLSLKDNKLGVPGNVGLKDMVMALKWIKNNIESFNGDPNNVTIFGESAGGAAVHYLMLSPMAKGLFHKAIALSGAATNPWACGKTGAAEIAGILGFNSKDEQKILNFLQNATKEEIVTAQRKCKNVNLADTKPWLGPVVEKFNNSDDCFLNDEPTQIMLSGNYNKVPLMMGYTSREGMLYDYLEKEQNTSFKIKDFETSVPYILSLEKDSALSLEIAKKIKNFYFGAKDPVSQEAQDEYYKLQTDNFFLRGIYTSALNHAKTSNTPVYLYRFSFEGDLNILRKLLQMQRTGVCHADDLGYLFKSPFTPEVRPESSEGRTLKRFIKYLTNFAKRGDPNPQKLDDLFPALWKPVTKDCINFVDINENLTVGCNPENDRMKFWDSILGINM